MLLATQSTSITGTQKYFEEVLTQGDYYLGQEIAGHWHGRGAEILGVGRGAKVTKEQFFDLLQGRHPVTGERLTQRIRKDRRPGVDLTFSVPKSVSLAWAILRDERILEILRESVHETMEEDIEPLMQRRVRTGKHANSKRKASTGKLIYADFLHKTARPVDGLPDPHLHVHAFVMNWTEDGGKHYAGELEEIVRQRPSLQAKFEARLARKLQALGYVPQHVRYMQSGRQKRGWEIKGIMRSTIEKFSRRTAQVEQYAEEHGIEDAEEKGRLGKLTREKKDDGKPVDALRAEWRSRLTPRELASFRRLKTEGSSNQDSPEAQRAWLSVRYALDHHLFRQSTVERHQLVGTALEHGLTLKTETVEQALDAMDIIQRTVDVNGSQRCLITTRAVLESERQLIAYAREGRGTRRAISVKDHVFVRDWLNDHQKAAVEHILNSRDTVMAVVGGAGTGKTSLMQEATEAIGQNGKEVFTCAPSTGAKEVLQDKGFANAQTVEHIVRNTKMHSALKDQVLWIDEAALVDVRTMNKVFKIAKEQNARVVLSGDTRQHSSPGRGEAMRLLENEAGLKMARVEKIQRQSGQYKRAVALISKGYDTVDLAGTTGLLAGFDLLDSMGKIKEISSDDRHAQLAATYLSSTNNGKSTLIVAPTHAEAQAATEEVRKQLQSQGKLSSEERVFTQYKSLNLTEAEKSEPRTYAYQKDLIVQFHQNVKGGFKRGDRYRIVATGKDKVELIGLDNSQRKSLPLRMPDRFEVYSENELHIAAGDKIRFSLGGVANDGKQRISNGRLDSVKGFDKHGNLILQGGCVVGKNYGHLDLGYVITSHASQGKDRHVAIAAMGSESLPAINAKQFYVTVSRGSENVALFVDDKTKVRQAIQRSGEQLSASEMIQKSKSARSESKQRKMAQYRQQTHHTFRDRVIRWWRSLRQDRSAAQTVGRHRQSSTSRNASLGRFPSPGRSRG